MTVDFINGSNQSLFIEHLHLRVHHGLDVLLHQLLQYVGFARERHRTQAVFSAFEERFEGLRSCNSRGVC